MTEIGLFPLPLVLLPTEQVPLHIFEERYKELIGECIEDDDEFGLVYADDDGVREIGTRAGVVEVLTEFDDGRLNILVEGRERFRMVEVTGGRSFDTAEVAPVDDAEDPSDEETIDKARSLFERLRELTGSEVEMPGAETAQLSFALAARVELAPDLKLELLTETSERVRLARVCELLEGATVSVERQRRAADRASRNGKVELG
jgi:Lon protease-like protein